MLRIVNLLDIDREELLTRLCRRERAASPDVLSAARAIIDDVRARGDIALREITERIERRSLTSIELPRAEWERLADSTAPDVRSALARAHARIRRFHDEEARHLSNAAFAIDEITDGGRSRVELRVRPLARVGVYAPGGSARYPSTVLMAVAAARAAGVGEVLLTTPGPSPEVLHAARIAGVDRVFTLGGAQAIAAFAYGTETVKRVDKIVGPGNAWVAAAKRIVFGDVAIDSIAGPSEILVIADARANPIWAAADLLSQAEHDGDAAAILVTPSADLAARVAAEVERQIVTLPRRAIAETAIRSNSAAIVTRDLDEAIAFSERFAPEHLELLVESAAAIAARITNAGAVFIGDHTPEAIGDYYAGPNHVLPTAGAARFSSPLGVHDFVKRISMITYSAATLRAHAADVKALAAVEGLDAHARAVTLRTEGGK